MYKNKQFYVFGTVPFDIIVRPKPKNAQFSKLIFDFCYLRHVSNVVGSSSGRQTVSLRMNPRGPEYVGDNRN